MAKKGEFRYSVDPNGFLYVERYGEYNGEPNWFYHEGDIPAEMDMKGRMVTQPTIVSSDESIDTTRMNDLRRDSVGRAKQAAMSSAVETWGRGESAVGRRKEAEAMPFWDRTSTLAGEFADSMMGGIKDIAGFINDPAKKGYDPSAGESAPDYLERASSENYSNFNDRRKKREHSDRMTQELKDFSTGAEFLAELPTYYLSGAGSDILKLGNTIRPGYFGKMPVSRKDMSRKTWDFEPIDMLPRRELYGQADDPFRKDMYEDIAQLTALSGAEGMVNPDDTFLGGVMGGGSGAMGGRMLSGKMENMPDLNTPNSRRILDRAKERGYKPSPGLDRNNPGLIADEAGLRSRNEYVNMFSQYDRTNDMALLNMAAEAVGLKLPPNSRSIDPTLLKNHMEELSGMYQILEGNTTGVINPGALDSVYQYSNRLPRTELGSKAADDLKALADQVKELRTKPGTFTGREYQSQRQSLMKRFRQADGNFELQQGIQDLVKILDEGIDTGMRQGLGDGGYVKWKQLNDQFAMTSMLKDHGLTPIGTLNPKGISEHIQRTQKDNMLMPIAQGSPIGDFVELSQLDYLTRYGEPDKAKSGMSSASVESADKIQPMSYFFQTPDRSKLKAGDKLKARAYFDYGYPVNTGMLNIGEDSSLRMAQLGRARGQGSDMDERATTTVRTAKEMYDALRDRDAALIDKYKNATGELGGALFEAFPPDR